MKITERQRLAMGLAMIEEVSSCAQTLNPKREWKESYEAVIDIYTIVHSLRNINCRKNHPDWIEKIDAAIRKTRRGK